MRSNKTLSKLIQRRPRGRALLFGLAALAWGGTAQAQTYCASSVYNPYPLCRVDFADMTSAPTSSNGYVDNTAFVASVSQGSSYTLSVSSNTNYGWYISAFFDWDHNGSFETKVNVGVAGTCPGAPLTGTIAVPVSAVNATTRMRVICNYQGYTGSTDGCGTETYGQVLDYSVLVGPPPTCLAPTLPVVSNVTTSTANLSWTASTSGPSGGYQWEVRSSGNPGDPSPAASGSTAGTTASASGLTPGVATYKLYVRADCGSGDLSSWKASAAFETANSVACGAHWYDPGGPTGPNSSAQYIKTTQMCPTNSGDVVTLSFDTWTQMNWNIPQSSPMFIHNGSDLSAPLVVGDGTGYTDGTWTVPAGGWISQPPAFTSTAASGCLTVQVFSYGSWVNDGWDASVTCALPPTCFAPTNITVAPVTTQGGTVNWTSTSAQNQYRVVANGQPVTSAALATGIVSSTPFTISGLTGNTTFSLFARGICTPGDTSAWSPAKKFKTLVGCGANFDFYRYNTSGGQNYYTSYPNNMDSVTVICPNNSGDVVTLTFSEFHYGQSGDDAMYVYNGPTTGSPLFASARGATSGSPVLPAGGYWGNFFSPGDANFPGPFTSTDAGGCLTVRYRSNQYQGSSYDSGTKSSVTCAPVPCATPGGITVSAIGADNATLTWTGSGTNYILEYGAPSFTPGTGATAGAGGTVISNVTSPYVLSGLSAATAYKVVVRNVCTGPLYSDNSFATTFYTSMDCSTAQVLSCGQYVSDDDAPAQYTLGSAAYTETTYTGAVGCLGGGATANGPERLYRFTASGAGTYGILGGVSDQGGSSAIGYVMTSVSNGCAAPAFTCIGTVPANAGGNLTFTVPAAGDYYIMSDANYVVHKRPFTLACPGVPACVTTSTFPANGITLAVNTNPIVFTWPAVFGADSYDVYFQGAFVANTPTNSINGGSSYTTANVAALVGLGNPVTWRVVPKNSYGTATCPTNWSFSVGGNGTTNAISLTEGVAYSGNRHASNGYTNLNTTYNGSDAWFKFTATPCALQAEVNLCLNVGSNAVAMTVIRASDQAVVFPPTGYTTETNPYYMSVADSSCFKFRYYDYDIQNYVGVTPSFDVVPGETYYVIADGYASPYDFQMSYNEVVDPTDDDGDGIPNCADSCPFSPGVEGGACTPSAGFGTGKIIDCECVDGNMATISITTDSNPAQLSWTIDNGTTVVASGAPTAAQANMEVSETVFLAGSCYGFKLMDSFGDGINGGGWKLKTTDGRVLLADDFADGFDSPSTSPLSASYTEHGFCLPAGPSNILASECGIYTNNLQNKVYCSQVSGATSYQFQFSDPDAGFYRFIARNRNYVIFNEMVTYPLTPGVKYFARVRTNAGGPLASAHFGSGCEMGLGVAQTIPCAELINAPAYGHSCNEVRSFNYGNRWIYATPVTGATEYQFRISIPGEGYDVTMTRSTYILELKWNADVAPVMVNGSTYNVEVNVKVNGVYSGFCGELCTITINSGGNRPEASMMQASGTATMWPNPVREGQVNLSIDGIQDADQDITVDIQDVYGKQVFAKEFGNSGERFTTILDLPSDIASGVYMVNITVNGQTTVQRLSILK